MQVEELLNKLGSPGRYQLLIYVCLWLCNATSSINHVLMAVIGYTPPFSCIVENPSTNASSTLSQTLGESKASRCLAQYSLSNTSNKMVYCPNQWTFQTDKGEATIVSEWSLVCDKRYLVGLASTLYFTGVLIGSAIFGQLSDSYGRKTVLLVTLYSYIVVSIGVYFTDSITAFIIVRTIVGFLIQGIQMSSYVLLAEFTVLRFRPIFVGIYDVFWSVGLIWMATLSWSIPDWRNLQLALCLPSLITLVYIVILPESIRWLANKKIYNKADEVAKRIARFNKVQLADDLELYLEHPNANESKNKKYTFWNLCKTPRIRIKTFIFGFAWFASALGYYGLLLSTGEFPGNRHQILFISSLSELGAMICAFCALRYLPRRIPLAICYFCGGVMCITCGVLRNNPKQDVRNVSTVLAIIGRVFMTASFPIVSLFSVESFPTVLRTIGIGSCVFWARISGIIAPQILLLEETATELPFILFGIVSVLASIGILFLAETRRHKLPETVEEIEKHRTIHTSLKPGTTLKYSL